MLSYRFRLYPSKSQSAKMQITLDLCRELYNASLYERQNAWEHKISINYHDQRSQLPDIKKDRPEFRSVHSQVLQDVLRRMDKAFQNFFRRVKNHENPGYPRFRGERQYQSFTYPQYGHGVKIVDNSVHLSKIGNIQMKIHRSIDGNIKVCTISKSLTGKWFASFSCEIENKPLPESTESTGIDVGLHTFAILSNGDPIPNPRFFHENEKRLAKSQRKMSNEEKGSIERSKKRKIVSHIHERISNLRSNFTHELSRRIVNQYGIICLEDLPVKEMGEDKRYSKSIHDVAWGMFRSFVSYKAEHAGRICKSVNPAFTSQTCSRCGSLNCEFIGRMFHCLDCGLLIDRDHNAAIDIERLGLQSLGLEKTREVSGICPVEAVTIIV